MHAIGHALAITGSMTWQIAWALILGFALSAIVQAVVRKPVIVRLLGDDRPRTLAVATGLGAASSSCSYAAVALARSLFRKGADFTAAMAFEIASTNLVIELGVILALLMGWQFTLAEFTGGPVMIVVLAVLFRIFLRDRLLRQAREQADRGVGARGRRRAQPGRDRQRPRPGIAEQPHDRRPADDGLHDGRQREPEDQRPGDFPGHRPGDGQGVQDRIHGPPPSRRLRHP